MAYATGTANSAADLVSAITSFLTANGWTLTSGALSKGSNHFRVDLSSINGVHPRLEMGTAAGFAAGTGVSGANLYPYISLNGVWPIFYRFFFISLNGADTFVCCAQEANNIEYKYLMFGNLENKVGTTWTGGQWMHGTYGSQTSGGVGRASNAGIDIVPSGTSNDATGGDDTESYTQGHGGLFMMQDGNPNFGNNFIGPQSFVRCDIDGGTYKGNKQTSGVGNNSMIGCVDAMRFARLFLFRQPNTWNGESVLVPIHVRLGRATNTSSRLGTIGHVRYMRMDNYEPGDIVTLGTDRWMVLPMYLRNAATPTGLKGTYDTTAITGHSGQLAYAIRYDGP